MGVKDTAAVWDEDIVSGLRGCADSAQHPSVQNKVQGSHCLQD